MMGDMPCHVAPAGGVADVDSILEVGLFDQRGKLIGVGVEIIAIPRLAGEKQHRRLTRWREVPVTLASLRFGCSCERLEMFKSSEFR